MKIHPVKETFQMTHVLDPEKGTIRVKQSVLGHPGIESIQDGDKSYYVNSDGSFEVPPEVGAKFVNKVIGGISWYEGSSPLALPDVEQEPARAIARRR